MTRAFIIMVTFFNASFIKNVSGLQSNHFFRPASGNAKYMNSGFYAGPKKMPAVSVPGTALAARPMHTNFNSGFYAGPKKMAPGTAVATRPVHTIFNSGFYTGPKKMMSVLTPIPSSVSAHTKYISSGFYTGPKKIAPASQPMASNVKYISSGFYTGPNKSELLIRPAPAPAPAPTPTKYAFCGFYTGPNKSTQVKLPVLATKKPLTRTGFYEGPKK